MSKTRRGENNEDATSKSRRVRGGSLKSRPGSALLLFYYPSGQSGRESCLLDTTFPRSDIRLAFDETTGLESKSFAAHAPCQRAVARWRGG